MAYVETCFAYETALAVVCLGRLDTPNVYDQLFYTLLLGGLLDLILSFAAHWVSTGL